jgi:hypothetical protein
MPEYRIMVQGILVKISLGVPNDQGETYPQLAEDSSITELKLTLREEAACDPTGPGYRLVLASEVYNIDTGI